MRGTGLCRRRDPWHATGRRDPLNLLTVSGAEMRAVTQAQRRPYDPVSVVLGRVARDLAESGAIDGELALSFVLAPTEAMLEAVSHRAAVA